MASIHELIRKSGKREYKTEECLRIHFFMLERRIGGRFLKKCENIYIGTNFLNKHLQLLHEAFGLKSRNICKHLRILWKIIKDFGLRCLVVYLMEGAADPTMDLWLETDSHIFFDSKMLNHEEFYGWGIQH